MEEDFINEVSENEEIDEIVDISECASDDEIESIKNYVNRYFNSDSSKNVYNDFIRLSNFIKRKEITIGEIESDKLLDIDKIKNGLDILYRADILTRLSNLYNINNLVELYTLRNNLLIRKDAEFGLFYDSYGKKDLDLFKLYLDEISEYDVLTDEEEKELFIKAKNGDEVARNKFIGHNLRLVVSIAKTNTSFGLSLDDLVQYGNEGLLNAYNKFNPEFGFKFSTYAYWWIKQYIYRGIADASRTIRVPVYIHEFIIIIRRVIGNYVLENDGKIPNAQYISDVTGISLANVKLALGQLDSMLSLDVTMCGNDTFEHESTLADFIEDETSYDAFDAIDSKEFTDRILDGTYLTDREKFVIEARFGFKGRDYTLAEIGNLYGITREWVRQIELRALRKLRFTADNIERMSSRKVKELRLN